jgi:hypothetical protein
MHQKIHINVLSYSLVNTLCTQKLKNSAMEKTAGIKFEEEDNTSPVSKLDLRHT